MRRRLRPFEADRLRSARLSYDGVGGTLVGVHPAGYHHLDRTYPIGHGRVAFVGAVDALMRWGVQRGAGLGLAASAEVVAPGEVAMIRLGVGPFALRAPVRVVEVVDEPDRKGFAYGTLVGHPESGEELFAVELRPDQTVVLRIVAFSRPASWLARALGPFGRLAQAVITRRYGRALRPSPQTRSSSD